MRHLHHLLGFLIGLALAWCPGGLIDRGARAVNPNAPLPLAVAIHALVAQP